MRRYLYSNLIRILVDIFLGIVFLPTLVFMIWEILTDGVIDKMYYAICFRCIILFFLFKIITFILDKKAKNCIFFEKGKLIYKNRTLFSDEIKITYFKFYVNLICEILVIPKIFIAGKEFRLSFYLSRKDLKRIKKWALKWTK